MFDTAISIWGRVWPKHENLLNFTLAYDSKFYVCMSMIAMHLKRTGPILKKPLLCQRYPNYLEIKILRTLSFNFNYFKLIQITPKKFKAYT